MPVARIPTPSVPTGRDDARASFGADVAQLETNRRFALFFPEKRPFFLKLGYAWRP